MCPVAVPACARWRCPHATVGVSAAAGLIRCGDVRLSGRGSVHRTARRSIGILVGLLGVLPAASPSAAQETIAEARAELRRVEEEKLALQARIDMLVAEDIEVLRALRAAEELVARQEANVESAEQRLRAEVAILRQNEAAIGWAQLDVAEVRRDAEALIVEVYLQAGSSRTATLLGSEDLTQGLRRVALLEAVHGNAGDLLEGIRLAEDRYQAALEDAADSTVEVQRLQVGLEADLVALEARRAEQAAIKAELDVRRAALEREFAAWDREAYELRNFIQVEEYRRQAEEWVRAQEAAAASAGGFVWPTAGVVTSGYGNRLHPILGVYRLHSGIDLGSTHGQPVHAARAGVVITAGAWGGYGNTVVIDHGGGVSSLYAHLSQVTVSPGDLVRPLDRVGNIGSTGLSTGPHLHFEIRLNGTPVDPLGYLL